MTTQRNEMWRPCVAPYSTCYDVSDRGRVRRKDTSRILKLSSTKNGPTVRLSIDGVVKTFLVHRLVAFAFVRAMTAQSRVRHIDGNAENNHLGNLTVEPRRSKCAAAPNGRHRDLVRGTDHRAAKLDPDRVGEIRKLFDRGVNRREIAERFGISRQWVHALGRGEGWVSREELHRLRFGDRDHDDVPADEQALRPLGIDPATLAKSNLA